MYDKRRKGNKRRNEDKKGGSFFKKGRGQQQKKSYPEYEGVVQMTREGYAFVMIEGQEDDVFVKASKTRGALNKDRVIVAVTKPKMDGRRMEGEIVRVVERSRKPFIGVLHIVGSQAWVLMQSKSMPYDISIDVRSEEGRKLREFQGMKVAAVVDDWPRGEVNPVGHIVDVLGELGENDTEMHAILAEYGLPYRFEPEVENAADGISDKITADDLKMRRDFRDTLTFTIDPADAKDFDDALSFKKLPNGNYEIGVHIADVSWYVRPGGPVDKEAQARGTSVYLVDRTVPMLPEKLSNKLCSLRPKEDKLTFSAVFEIAPTGKVVDRWFGRTVINSDYRFAYETAQQIIDNGSASLDMDLRGGTDRPGGDSEAAMGGGVLEGTVIPRELKEAILILWDLADKFRKKRFASGAIGFDRPEMKVECDEKGRPVRVYQRVSKEANWLIEEFMLLANRSVAEFIATQGKFDGKERKNAKTFVYRIHDLPNTDKLTGLGEFAGNFGYHAKFGEGQNIAKELNSLLTAAKDKPEFMAIEMLALRSMAKAAYSTDNIGHYGLAFKFYTHFTSPIRRYPDTMVHRLLAMYLDGEKSQDKLYYEEQCVHASEREGIAAQAERDSIKYKLVEFMQDKVGGEFDGHISGLTDWGMYVEVEPTKIEGMIALRDIKSDFFEFNEKEYKIAGRRSGVVYRLGDAVKIRVKSTNLEQRLLDYELVETGLEERAPRGGSGASGKGSAPGHGNSAARKAKVHASIKASKAKKSSGRKPEKSHKK